MTATEHVTTGRAGPAGSQPAKPPQSGGVTLAVSSDGGGVTPLLRRSFKFLLRPTRRQEAALTAMLDDHRALYNGALEHRRELWRRHTCQPWRSDGRVGFYDQDAELREIRAELPQYARWAFSSERDQLRRLDLAFKAFYRRARAGEKVGYPRWRSRERFDSVTWAHGDGGARWLPEQRRISLKGIGQVRVHAHRPTRGRVKTVAVKREGRRWYVVLSCDQVPARPLPPTGAAVGVDLGVVHFATTATSTTGRAGPASDAREAAPAAESHLVAGEPAHVANPRPLRRSADRLERAQRELARKRRGSNRRRKARAQVAAIHRKVARQRRDFWHKTALALVREHDVLVVEALQVANMSRRPAPRPTGRAGPSGDTSEKPPSSGGVTTRSSSPPAPRFEPNGAAAKAGLNRSILDAGWSGFLLVLAEKAEEAARELVQVPPAYTSQTCSACGHVDAASRVSQARFVCSACGHQVHADVNAALVILRAGLVRQGVP